MYIAGCAYIQSLNVSVVKETSIILAVCSQHRSDFLKI
jgi:hypothetical protein